MDQSLNADSKAMKTAHSCYIEIFTVPLINSEYAMEKLCIILSTLASFPNQLFLNWLSSSETHQTIPKNFVFHFDRYAAALSTSAFFVGQVHW